MDDSNDKVEEEILKLIGHLNDSMSVLQNLTDDNREALVSSVEDIVKGFQTLHELQPEVTGSVPFDLIAEIDKGNNPDEYSKKLVEEYQLSAKRVEEKQKWMKAFDDHLTESIAANFSDVQ